MASLWKCLHWPFCPGVFIAILAFVAAAVTFRKEPSKREKMIWLVVFFTLMLGEIWMMSIDRSAQERAHEQAASDEVQHFQVIGNGISDSIHQAQDDFDATMTSMKTLMGTSKQTLLATKGGSGFPYLMALPPDAPGSDPRLGWQLVIANSEDLNLFDVEGVLREIPTATDNPQELVRKMTSGIAMQFGIVRPRVQGVMKTPYYIPRPGNYQIDIFTRNNLFSEVIEITLKASGGFDEHYLVRDAHSMRVLFKDGKIIK
jgi:hypothetical protein